MTPVSPGPASRGARRIAFRLVTAAACVSLLAGCFGGDDADRATPETAAPTSLPLSDVHASKDVADGGTLRLGVESFPATFNPVHTNGVMSTAPQILAPTLGNAVRVRDDGSWQVDPDYARSVEVTDTDPLTVRVELNPRAVWQGGTPITSADMVAYAAAMTDDDFASAGPAVFDDIDTVEPDGDDAYEVVFDDPNADWPAAVYPTLPAAITKDPEVFNGGFAKRAPSANGPYRVASIERSTGTIMLEPNPVWWGDPPHLDAIVWRVADAEVLAKAYEADELEAAPVTPAIAKTFADSDDLRVSRGSEWSQLTVNGGTGPLSDVKVRRAIFLAVDTDAVVEAASRRSGAPAEAMDSVVRLPGQVGHTPVKGARRDIDRAAALLADAGWKRQDGSGPALRKGKPLRLRMPVPAANLGARQRADQITEDLAEIGVEVTVTEVPEATFFSRVVVPLDFDLTTFSWSTQPFGLSMAKQMFTPIDGPLNFTGKASDATADAFDAAIEQLDEAKRTKAIAKVDAVARAQASILPLAVAPRVEVVDRGVVNYGPAALADLDWTIVGFAPKQDKD